MSEQPRPLTKEEVNAMERASRIAPDHNDSKRLIILVRTLEARLAESEDRRRQVAAEVACDHCETTHERVVPSCCDAALAENAKLALLAEARRDVVKAERKAYDLCREKLDAALARLKKADAMADNLRLRSDGLARDLVIAYEAEEGT